MGNHRAAVAFIALDDVRMCPHDQIEGASDTTFAFGGVEFSAAG